MNIFELLNEKYVLPPNPKLFETFAGVGCQRMAFNRLGIEVEMVGISEIDKYAIQSYMAIHGPTKNWGDITKIRGQDLPEVDVFTYSFPCTDLSKAGKQKGLTSTRSGLVYEVLRILHEMNKLPQVLIMENVVDLVQTKFIREFNDIQRELESLGYKNYTETLNAKDYGVAQNRDRVFMVSILGEYYYEFPKPFKLTSRLKDYLEVNVDEKYYLSQKTIEMLSDMKDRNGYIRGDRFKPYNPDQQKYAYTVDTREGGRTEDNFLIEPIINVVGSLNPDKECQDRVRVLGSDGICQGLRATDYKDPPKIQDTFGSEPKCLNSKVNGKQPSLQDRIYDSEAIATAITTGFLPSITEPIACEERLDEGLRVFTDNNMGALRTTNSCGDKRIIEIAKPSVMVLGNYTPGEHNASRIVDDNGLAPAVKENHGTVTAIQDPIIIDDYNQAIRSDQSTIGTITTNIGNNAPRNGFKLMNSQLRIRKLTPRECWRLMSIDDSDFDKASSVCSNSQLYKQAGNGICVNVFAEILKMMTDQKEESCSIKQ